MNATISAPVGLGPKARHLSSDVRVVQDLLNGVGAADGGPKVKLVVDGFCGSRTTGAIQPFQLKQKNVLISVGRWLKVDTSSTPTARAQAASVVQRAINLMDRNLHVKTSTGGDPPLRRVSDTFHAAVDFGKPDNGVNCGDKFFTVDGPNCRRDVVTHEFFHFVGVHHGNGGASLSGPTVRRTISPPVRHWIRPTIWPS